MGESLEDLCNLDQLNNQKEASDYIQDKDIVRDISSSAEDFIEEQDFESSRRLEINDVKEEMVNVKNLTQVFTCNICQKILSSKQSLTNHILTHDVSKEYF